MTRFDSEANLIAAGLAITTVTVLLAQWLFLKAVASKLRIKAESWLLPSTKNEWDEPPPKSPSH